MANPGPSSSNFINTVAVLTPVNTVVNPVPQGTNATRLLCVARAANVNSTGDTAMPIINSTSYSITNVVFTNGSVSLTNAAAGVFTSPLAGGTAISTNAALATMTASNIVFQRGVTTFNLQTAQTLYFNVGTAQGSAATADIFVYGYDLS